MFKLGKTNVYLLQKLEPKDDYNEKVDKDYKPHGIINRQQIKPPPEKHARRSKRYETDPACTADKPQVFYSFTFLITNIFFVQRLFYEFCIL